MTLAGTSALRKILLSAYLAFAVGSHEQLLTLLPEFHCRGLNLAFLVLKLMREELRTNNKST